MDKCGEWNWYSRSYRLCSGKSCLHYWLHKKHSDSTSKHNYYFNHFLVSFKSKLGDIVYVQLPDVGETVTEGGKKLIQLETVCYLTELEYKYMLAL